MRIAVLGVGKFSIGGVFGDDDIFRGVHIDILSVNPGRSVVAFIGTFLRHGNPPLIAIAHAARAHARRAMHSRGGDPIGGDDLLAGEFAALRKELPELGIVACGQIKPAQRKGDVFAVGEVIRRSVKT